MCCCPPCRERCRAVAYDGDDEDDLQGDLDDGLAQQGGPEEGPEGDAQVATRDACSR